MLMCFLACLVVGQKSVMLTWFSPPSSSRATLREDLGQKLCCKKIVSLRLRCLFSVVYCIIGKIIQRLVFPEREPRAAADIGRSRAKRTREWPSMGNSATRGRGQAILFGRLWLLYFLSAARRPPSRPGLQIRPPGWAARARRRCGGRAGGEGK